MVARALASAAGAKQLRRLREAAQPVVRLLIVEPEPMVLLGLTALFEVARHCHVVGAVNTAEEGLAENARQKPDVVLLDAELAGLASLIERLCADHPSMRALALGSAVDPQLTVAAIHAGVSGYVLRRTDPNQLVHAVEVLGAGEYFFDDEVVEAVQRWLRAGQPTLEPLERLSDQERNVLGQIAEGKTNRQIATSLGLSEFTVKTYVSSLLRKLGVTSRAEAAARYVKRNTP